MIIGITGTLGAGKGTIVEFLKNRGFNHYSVRDFLTEELEKIGVEVNRDNMVKLANNLRERNSPSYIAEKLFEEAQKQGGNCVIESLRTEGEVNALKSKGEFFLFAVDADIKSRYSRIIVRRSTTDNVSFDEFVENEKREMTSNDPNKQNLSRCIEMADFIFQNNQSIQELYKKVDEALNIISSGKKVVEEKKEISSVIKKRENPISWDEYFMGVALLSGQRSKDPSTQVGACIVDENKHIIGAGYNGFPIGCSDENLPWAREGTFLETKYPYVCHAELNAILNSTKTLKNCKIYVALFPCNECAKAIIQSGIKEVIYLSDKYSESDSVKASKKMFDQTGVVARQLISKIDEVVIKLK